MTEETNNRNVLETIGILHIFRAFGMALHPPKVGLALMAILATFLVGGLLDVLSQLGDGGIDPSAIDTYAGALALDLPYSEPAGDTGVFGVWIAHTQACIEAFLRSVIPGIRPSSGLTGAPAGVLAALGECVTGCRWLITCHPIFTLLMVVLLLPIWSLAGGAICRIAAVQFTQGEKQTLLQGLRYARKNLLGGFGLAPCIPLIGAAGCAIVLIIGGAFLRIPFLGDIISGPIFFLAIFGGFIVTALLVGLVVGGSLFWPAIAAEGQDAYDAFSRGLSYAWTRPWKTFIYAAIFSVFGGICWQLIKWATYTGLDVTRSIVAFGTSPFGWWNRGTEESPASKLSLLWPTGSPGQVYALPAWDALSWYECVSAFFIGLFVVLTLVAMWAVLVSLYFSGSSVIYFLLRRDVDGIDLEDLYSGDSSLAAPEDENTETDQQQSPSEA